ncbi:MAG: hypothetical protein WC705_00510 [Candidatus Paceibacterota bacterium]|jgi:hypothetical protein
MIENSSPPKEESFSVYEGRFSYWKASLLGLFTCVSALAFGFFLKKVLFGLSNNMTGDSFFLLIFLLIFLSFFSVTSLFVSRNSFMTLIAFLSAVFIFVVFLPDLNQRIAIAGLILAGFLMVSVIMGRNEIDGCLKIKFFRIVKPIMSRVIIGIAIFSSFLVYNSFLTRPLDNNNPFLPQNVFESSFRGISGIIGKFLGDVDFSLSLNEITAKLVDQSIPPAIKNDLIKKSTDAYQKQFSSMLGINLDPNIKLSLAIYQGIINKFNSLGGSSKSSVLTVLAVLLFLAVQAVSPLIRIVASFFGLVIYQVLLAIGFGAVVFENRSKETISLP